MFSNPYIVEDYSDLFWHVHQLLTKMLKISCLQLNISFPATGCQKLIEVDDEKKLRTFYEKRMSQEVSAECLGDEWKVCNKYLNISNYYSVYGYSCKATVM